MWFDKVSALIWVAEILENHDWLLGFTLHLDVKNISISLYLYISIISLRVILHHPSLECPLYPIFPIYTSSDSSDKLQQIIYQS